MIHTCDKCSLTFDDVVPWIKHKKICMGSSKKDVGVQVNLCECESHKVKPQVARPSTDVRSEAQTTVQQDSVEGKGASRTCVQCKITKSLDQYYNGKYTCKECTKTDVICPYCRKVIRKTNLKRHIKNVHKK